MKKQNKPSKTPLPPPEEAVPTPSEEEIADLLSRLHIPPGVALNDIFLDNQDVTDQLHICKRVLTNMRKNGELSYTQLSKNGKVFYLKQEIAGILKQNIVIGKNSPLRKAGLKCIGALIAISSICSPDLVELVNSLMPA
jgi:hypothetical protein